ncbi:nucleotidyltransferase family protein [Neolewinella aurantiaca]|uniref:Nucleotidyltransferase family protein n=1 Tax=Neolewinella aurantiaca TaxID=2602767 RepID=A0A5C7FDL1_9BACT|nr:nucleotidyltransferase family protein [Neolewinella aurantiaca]TXF87570.1 nucleotidyltransferase family protein [Neolewinella aurantiaca]
MGNVVQIVLAAGGSSRMGQAKQLLKVNGESMVRRVVQAARATANRVVVVTGSSGSEVYHELKDLAGVLFAYNPRWEEGIGRSVAIGVATANIHSTEAYFITLADQPLIETRHLERYLEAYHKSPDRIIATAYPNGPGVPAIFPARLEGELLRLEGRTGAKQLIIKEWDNLSLIDASPITFDVDTPEDYEAVTGHKPE